MNTTNRADFSGSDLAGACFSEVKLTDAKFDKANLKGAQFDNLDLVRNLLSDEQFKSLGGAIG